MVVGVGAVGGGEGVALAGAWVSVMVGIGAALDAVSIAVDGEIDVFQIHGFSIYPAGPQRRAGKRERGCLKGIFNFPCPLICLMCNCGLLSMQAHFTASAVGAGASVGRNARMADKTRGNARISSVNPRTRASNTANLRPCVASACENTAGV